jgi:predicted nucleotidyltransferase
MYSKYFDRQRSSQVGRPWEEQIDIINKLFEILEELPVEKERILFLSLYGSQNYQLDGPDSDLDCECIVFPTHEDIVFGSQMVAQQYHTKYGFCMIKDVRAAFNELVKCSPNMLEVFGTPYLIYNIDYQYLINQITMERINTFSNNNIPKLIKALNGLFEKYWAEDGRKNLANAIRINQMINRIIDDEENFFDCLYTPVNYKKLQDIRFHPEKADVDFITEALKEIKDRDLKFETYFKNADFTPDPNVVGELRFWEDELMTKYIKLNF